MKADQSEHGVDCDYVLISTAFIILRELSDVNITDGFKIDFCYFANFSSQEIEELDTIAVSVNRRYIEYQRNILTSNASV